MAAPVAQPIPFAILNGRRFEAETNPNLYKKDENGRLVPKGKLDFISDYCKTANGGPFRGIQLLDRILRIVVIALKEVGSALASTFEKMQGKVALAWQFTVVPRMFAVAPTTVKALQNWFKTPQGPDIVKHRDRWQKVHDIAEGAATCGVAAFILTANEKIKTVADVPTLVSDVTELALAREDWSLAKAHLEAIDRDDPDNIAVRDRFLYTMRESFIRMVKAVSSVFSGILGFLVLGFGGPALPSIILIGVGLISTVAAMAAWFYKETSPYTTVDFFKIRHPEVLGAAPAA